MKISIVNNKMELEPETEAEQYQLEYVSKRAREQGLAHQEYRQWSIQSLTFTIEKKPQ